MSSDILLTKKIVYAVTVIMAVLTVTSCTRISEDDAVLTEAYTDEVTYFSETETSAETAASEETFTEETVSEETVQVQTSDTEITSVSVSDMTQSEELSEYVCYADEEHVKICGRTLYEDNIRYLGYSCSAIEFDFYGKYAELKLIPEPEQSEDGEYSYYSLTVNSNEIYKGLLTEETVLCAVDSDTAENFRVKLTKLSEGCFGAVGIGYIKVNAYDEIQPVPQSEYKIEFIGDSLTCGYGDEAASANERFSTSTENGLIGYAALTAEKLGFDYNIIGMNGIGIVSRYTAHGEKRTDGFLMPDLYRYTDGFRSEELWDSSNFAPDICVIALGANDNSYTLGIQDREAEFSEKYIEFINQVRDANPKAYIICASGIQQSNLYDVIASAVDKYIDESGDNNISSFRFNSQKASEGYGSDYHPSAVSQQRFADELYNKIIGVIPQ